MDKTAHESRDGASLGWSARLGRVASPAARLGDTQEADAPPAGSLVVENAHTLPHEVTLRVLDVGWERDGFSVIGDPDVPSGQALLRTTLQLAPGETASYEQIFTEPVWYTVQLVRDGFGLANPNPQPIPFNPVPPDEPAGKYFYVRLDESDARMVWKLKSTENMGKFED